MFSEIYIERTLPDGTIGSRIKVPLMYAKREKVLTRLLDDPSGNRKASIVLPVISFEMGSMQYDGLRKLQTVNKIVKKDDTDKNRVKFAYVAVPYNIPFKLSILVKNAEDGTKIVEQILPFFTPDFTASLELIPELGIVQDIPLILNSVTLEDVMDEQWTVRRSIVWELNFTMKGYLYGPVKHGPIIKFANTEFVVPTQGVNANSEQGEAFMRITTTPGLTANGEPTTNASLTVAWANIDIDDSYGFIDVKEIL
jgi:hypothetical protein